MSHSPPSPSAAAQRLSAKHSGQAGHGGPVVEFASDLSVSPGDNSLSVTPKDVTPADAAARDLMARHVDSRDPDEKQQALLDDAIDLSFPASDPPAVAGGITRIDKPARATRR
ncbi:MAG: hypothetical protein RL404_143 [Pseudomonadota bacterium]|jgi:hypothetical protein